MRYYLVDFENVNTHGLNGIENVGSDDTVCIFYSENANSISIEHHFAIQRSDANIFFQKVEVGGRNSLDFQLISYLGYVLCENREKDMEYFVVTRDREFRSLMTYWCEKGFTLSIIPDIAHSQIMSVKAEASEQSEISMSEENAAVSSHENEETEIPESQPQNHRTKRMRRNPRIQTRKKPENRNEKIQAIYDQHFKTGDFQEKRTEILHILCTGTSRASINNQLTKTLTGSEIKKIYKQFKPLLNELPGK